MHRLALPVLLFCAALIVISDVPPKVMRPDPSKASTDGDDAPLPQGLYSDEFVRALAPFELSRPNHDSCPFDIPCLDVVPNGKALPRREVFARLGLDEARLKWVRADTWGKVAFLNWQISPSYRLSCMFGSYPAFPPDEELLDPNQHIYGVRLMVYGQ
jgi:hypothetical protein